MKLINKRNLYLRIGFVLLIGISAGIGIAGTPVVSETPYQDGFEKDPFTTESVSEHIVETATTENYRVVYSNLEQSSAGASESVTIYQVSNVEQKAYYKTPEKEVYQDKDTVYTLSDGEVSVSDEADLETPPLTNQIVIGEEIGIPEFQKYRFSGEGTQENGQYIYNLSGVNPFLFDQISTIRSADGKIVVEESNRISEITVSIEALSKDGSLYYQNKRYTTQVEDVSPPPEPQWVTEYKLEENASETHT
jgi:type VI protein secretion system component Hcp